MQSNKRDYEVSIWTLQDEFITVLKPSKIEYRGQIENGKARIKDDGTLELNFSIPMYLYAGTTRVENPIWYNVRNGTIIANMRKIKLIFNKEDSQVNHDNNVFEFMIVGVKERHEEDRVYCDVSCESLAFHELGKKGFKVSLSSEDFYNDDLDFFNTGSWTDIHGVSHTSMPVANIQYWLNKFLTPAPANIADYDSTEWYYKIEMRWDAFSDSSLRQSNVIYEEPYTSSWELKSGDSTILVPAKTESYKEKERLVDLEESNYYNLTQNLAETFGVFCTYRYLYDSAYRIIGREIIFYNNFMKEKDGYLSLTYPYSASAITRELDSKDLTSKMFVKPVTDESNATGMITIMDVEANRSGEDYLLNFDYLYSINAITDEQYQEIDKYESKLGLLNKELIDLAEQIDALREEKIDVEATLTTTTNAIPLDQERISSASGLLSNLVQKYGDSATSTGIVVTNQNPDSAVLLHDASDPDGFYYFTLKKQGIDPKSLQVYTGYNYTNHTLSGPIQLSQLAIEYDEEYGEASKVKLYKEGGGMVYFTYTYIPKLYYEKVEETWRTKLARDQADKAAAEDRLSAIETELEDLQNEYNSKLADKKKAVQDFEKMMGSALRESYWMPEDYSNYGDSYVDTLSLVQTDITGNSGKTEFIWDTTPFEGEQLNSYKYGVNQDEKYYPIIRLDEHMSEVKSMLDTLCFIYYDPAITSDNIKLKYARSYPIKSKCQYGFAKIEENNEEKIIPVLILTGYEDIVKTAINGEETDNFFENLITNSQLGEYNVIINGSDISVSITNPVSLLNYFINYNASAATKFSTVNLVYPRIKVNSLALKTSSDQLAIKYNATPLNEYEDFSILTRVDANASKGAYYINLRPRTLIGNAASANDALKIKFTLSNADTAIYLDAKKILKENSMPKVSYTITPSVVDDEFLYTAYDKLTRICNINDIDLKFKNVQGYISELNLDLDMPQNDTFEIKNYKTKFEDLFSTIVAQTEEMKKSGYTIAQMAKNLNDNGEVRATAIEATPLWQDSFDNYFENSDKVKDYLKQMFDEAGIILGNASSALDNLQDVSAQNAAILSGFAANVQGGLTPTYTKSDTPPLEFKAGDIWEDSNGNRHVATSNSTDVTSAGGGWTKVANGSLAAITGAALDIDAQAGTIDLKAQNDVSIASGKDVNIVGNSKVNIGGTQINIGSLTYTDEQEQEQTVMGGINLVASAYDKINPQASGISKVLISPQKIEMASADIEMAAGNGIVMYASDDKSTTAVKINKDDGIYLGSSKGINLYTGNADGTNAANVQLNPNRLLLGVLGNSQIGTAAEFTREKIVLAAGNTIANLQKDDLESDGNASGVLIQKDFIGMATTGAGGSRTSASLSPNGIVLGTGNSTNGTLMELSPSKIYLGGANADVRIQSNNMIINTSAIGTASIFELGTGLASGSPSSKLKMDANGNLTISGAITATSGSFTGTINANDGTIGNWTIDTNRISCGTGSTYVCLDANPENLSSENIAIWAGNTYAAQAPFSVSRGGKLTATDAEITGTIRATNLYIGDSNIPFDGTVDNAKRNLIPNTVNRFQACTAKFYNISTSGAYTEFQPASGQLYGYDANVGGNIGVTRVWRVVRTGSQNWCFQLNLPLTYTSIAGGTNLTFSFDLNSYGTMTNNRCELCYAVYNDINQSSVKVGYAVANSNITIVENSAWNRYTCSFTLPTSNAGYLMMAIRIYANSSYNIGSGNGIDFLDTCCLEYTSGATGKWSPNTTDNQNVQGTYIKLDNAKGTLDLGASSSLNISSGGALNIYSAGFNVRSNGYTPSGTSETIVMWAGKNSNQSSDFDKASTPFFVTNEGKLYARQIYTKNGNVESSFNATNLWKVDSAYNGAIASVTTEDGVVTIKTLGEQEYSFNSASVGWAAAASSINWPSATEVEKNTTTITYPKSDYNTSDSATLALQPVSGWDKGTIQMRVNLSGPVSPRQILLYKLNIPDATGWTRSYPPAPSGEGTLLSVSCYVGGKLITHTFS